MIARVERRERPRPSRRSTAVGSRRTRHSAAAITRGADRAHRHAQPARAAAARSRPAPTDARRRARPAAGIPNGAAAYSERPGRRTAGCRRGSGRGAAASRPRPATRTRVTGAKPAATALPRRAERHADEEVAARHVRRGEHVGARARARSATRTARALRSGHEQQQLRRRRRGRTRSRPATQRMTRWAAAGRLRGGCWRTPPFPARRRAVTFVADIGRARQ